MQWTVVVHYLRLAVWPRGLVLDYSDWPRETPLAQALPAAGLLLALFTASVLAIRQRLWWGFWARGSSSCSGRLPVSCHWHRSQPPSGECTCHSWQ
jgi:hypothetical protein